MTRDRRYLASDARHSLDPYRLPAAIRRDAHLQWRGNRVRLFGIDEAPLLDAPNRTGFAARCLTEARAALYPTTTDRN